jgi:hypothetical protein
MLGWIRAAVEKDCRGTRIIVMEEEENKVGSMKVCVCLGLGKGWQARQGKVS